MRDIQTIAVGETARRGGLGRALMNAPHRGGLHGRRKEVFPRGAGDNPSSRNDSMRPWDSRRSQRVGYYQPDGVDAIVMRLDPPGRD
jgi:N6-L-threonylcarbamoyladenine synthase/ribosomal-protein-alanine N-acetyltransferase